MGFARFARVSAPLLLLTTFAVTAMCGCSGSAKELNTSGQAAGFVAEVASGQAAGEWSLASGASREVAQAWSARASIQDLGRRLRTAAKLPLRDGATWTCEMARQLVSLGAVGSVTSYDITDIEIVTREATQLGYKHKEIAAMLHDTGTIPFRDLAIATAVACGPKIS